MPNFILAYHGGEKPETPEQGEEHMAKWKAWVDDLGESLINPGTPLGQSKTVSASGVTNDGGSNPINGYSILKADNIDAAVAMVKSCPVTEMGGTIEVAEMFEM